MRATSSSRRRRCASTASSRRPHPIFVDHFKFLKSVATGDAEAHHPVAQHDAFPRRPRARSTSRPIPTWPSSMPISRRVYARGDRSDLADAGCRYLQLDEVNFAYLCDPGCASRSPRSARIRRRCRIDLCRLINDAIADQARRTWWSACISAAAISRAPGSPKAATSRSPRRCSTRSMSTAISSNMTTPRAGDFAPLRFVPKGKIVVLGLVTTKRADARDQGRAEAPHRGGRALLPARPARLSARNAASPAPSTATRSPSRTRSPSSASSSRWRRRSGGRSPTDFSISGWPIYNLRETMTP